MVRAPGGQSTRELIGGPEGSDTWEVASNPYADTGAISGMQAPDPFEAASASAGSISTTQAWQSE